MGGEKEPEIGCSRRKLFLRDFFDSVASRRFSRRWRINEAVNAGDGFTWIGI